MTESAINPAWLTARPRPVRRRARIGVLAAIPSPPLPESDPLAELPPVQRAVARLIAEGWTYGDIAGALGIARDTVDGHANAAYRTLGIDGEAHQSGRLLARMVGAWAGIEAARKGEP